MRSPKILLMTILCIFLCSCAQTRTVKTPIYKDRDLEVELRRSVGTDSASSGKGYSHPRVFEQSEMKFLLGAIRYQDKGLIGWTDAKAVFSAHELYVITPHIVDAFGKASNDDEVVFASNVSKSGMVLSQKRYTDGIMFIRDGKLNCAFANINIRSNVSDGYESDVYEGDPRKISAGGLARLVTKPWQSLHMSDRDAHENWIMIDIATALEEKAAVEKAFQRQMKSFKKRERRRVRESVDWEEWKTDEAIETE